MSLKPDPRKDATLSESTRTILIVAGEASGDLHGSGLIREMRHLRSDIRFYGIGGNKMERAGAHLIAHSSEMAVVGLTEVAAKLSFILGVFFKLKKSIRNEKPDLVILIDYPDFNLPLARAAKKSGIKVFYYISPQVWAWRKGRIRSIRKYVDHIAVIFPFEETLYRKFGVSATFVGHPLLDTARTTFSHEEALRNFGLDHHAVTVALLPGSRQSEVIKLLPIMLKAAEHLKNEFPGIRFILPLADTLDQAFVEEIIVPHELKVLIIRDSIYDVLSVADAAIVTSGTATVDTALTETPMVVIYKVSGLTYIMGRMLINVDNIAMANIIAGKAIVPELIQGNATPKAIAKEVADLLKDEVKRETMIGELRKVREKLGTSGAAKRAAALAFALMEKDRRS
jgi:lipid-A-disaccharide synthase